MQGNAILGEPTSDTIRCLLFNAKESGAADATVFVGQIQGMTAAIWSTEGPPGWLENPTIAE